MLPTRFISLSVLMLPENPKHELNPGVLLWDANAAGQFRKLEYYTTPVVFSADGKCLAVVALKPNVQARSRP